MFSVCLKQNKIVCCVILYIVRGVSCLLLIFTCLPISYISLFFVLLLVYYLPVKPVYNQNILPTVFTTLPVIRYILLREKITVVHGHSVCHISSFCIYAHLFCMRLFSVPCVITNPLLYLAVGIFNAGS